MHVDTDVDNNNNNKPRLIRRLWLNANLVCKPSSNPPSSSSSITFTLASHPSPHLINSELR